MSSYTVENYVKAIHSVTSHVERGHRDGEPCDAASTGRLAEELGVLPGTVTSMLKTLQASGLADYKPYEGVRLTPAGTALALRVLRRHRLIELFLVTTLNLAWDEVHEEAENMEHAVSDLLVDRIDAFLGFPDADPHGDPIPRSDGSMAPTDYIALTSLKNGSRFRLLRVMDQSPDFLKYLAEQELGIESVGRLVSLVRSAGVVRVEVPKGEVVLAIDAASKLMVREESV